MSETRDKEQTVRPWQTAILDVLVEGNVGHVAYVPDGGHQGLIHLCRKTPSIGTTVLTTEEEGVALSAGLWLGGMRSVLLMQSSGVGNCVNMFALTESCRMPLVILVTMREEWAEFVPAQMPMGRRAPDVLKLMGFDVYRADEPDLVVREVSGAIDQAYATDRPVAVLLGQRLIGRKNWNK